MPANVSVKAISITPTLQPSNLNFFLKNDSRSESPYNGFDKDRFDKNGFDEDRFDKSGFDKDRFDKNGFDKDRGIIVAVGGRMSYSIWAYSIGKERLPRPMSRYNEDNDYNPYPCSDPNSNPSPSPSPNKTIPSKYSKEGLNPNPNPNPPYFFSFLSNGSMSPKASQDHRILCVHSSPLLYALLEEGTGLGIGLEIGKGIGIGLVLILLLAPTLTVISNSNLSSETYVHKDTKKNTKVQENTEQHPVPITNPNSNSNPNCKSNPNPNPRADIDIGAKQSKSVIDHPKSYPNSNSNPNPNPISEDTELEIDTKDTYRMIENKDHTHKEVDTQNGLTSIQLNHSESNLKPSNENTNRKKKKSNPNPNRNPIDENVTPPQTDNCCKNDSNFQNLKERHNSNSNLNPNRDRKNFRLSSNDSYDRYLVVMGDSRLGLELEVGVTG
jgi:hypothetical protein